MNRRYSYRPYSRVRSGRRASLLAVLSLSAVSAWCSPQTGKDILLTGFPIAGLRWSEPLEQKVFGSPLHLREFTADLSPEKVAHKLSQHADYFQRVMTWMDRIMLNGVRDGWHWLAEIQETRSGSQGRISIMPVTPETARPNSRSNQPAWQSGKSASSSWLDQAAHLRWRHESVHGRVTVLHEVYGSSARPEAARLKLKQELFEHGWKQQEGGEVGDFPGVQTWLRGSQRLIFITKRLATETAIYIHYFH